MSVAKIKGSNFFKLFIIEFCLNKMKDNGTIAKNVMAFSLLNSAIKKLMIIYLNQQQLSLTVKGLTIFY